MTGNLPRGIRNNNPGNIRKSNNHWQGLAATQSDPDFCTFTTMAYGVRAAAKIFLTYFSDGLNTVTGIINRWAPTIENPTSNYIAFVANHMEVSPGQKIDLHDPTTLEALLHAVFLDEDGGDYVPLEEIQSGVALALA